MPQNSFERNDVTVHPGAPREGRKKGYTTLSLFSGAMGLDIGLHRGGEFQLLAAVEKVPAFCKSILANRDVGSVIDKSVWVYEGDIAKLNPIDVMRDLGIQPGELDVLVGGPPCQAFSTSGKRASLADPRGTMLWEFLRFVEAFRPKIFLMENVRGLMSASIKHRPIADRPDRGGAPLTPEEQPGSVVDLFMKDLNGDYRMDIFEVNAVNYGAPQIRERVLFVGNREGIKIDFPEPTHVSPDEVASIPDAPLELFATSESKPWKTLGEALDGLSESDPVILDFSPRKKQYLDLIPPGSNWRSLPPEIAEASMGRAYFAKGGRSGWWRRLTFDLPSPTVTTMPNHASTALCHPTETRALTLRECARIQEFPDDWVFRGKPTEQFAQVGNAVPVRLGTVAGKVISDALDSLSNGAVAPEENLPIIRQVYIKSHIRTRRWFKDGKVVTWNAVGTNDVSRYSPAKTLHAERTRTKSTA